MATTATTTTAAAEAVQQLTQGYMGAWRKADAQAIAANFTTDGDFINPDGFHASGRAAIAAFYAQAFAMGYAGSEGGFDAKLARQIAPGVMLIDGEWSIKGARRADGAARPEERGILAAVLVETPHGWRVAALREQSSATKIEP